MTLEEYRKEKRLSYYSLWIRMLGSRCDKIRARLFNRWCLTAKGKSFPDPEMVKKILE